MKNNQFLSSLKAMHIFDPLEDLTLVRDIPWVFWGLQTKCGFWIIGMLHVFFFLSGKLLVNKWSLRLAWRPSILIKNVNDLAIGPVLRKTENTLEGRLSWLCQQFSNYGLQPLYQISIFKNIYIVIYNSSKIKVMK